jgi:hypothetical protein
MTTGRMSSLLIEAANRAEVTSLLIRCGYMVYRPEADFEGEDLVVKTPACELLGVQLKGRPCVDWARYGGKRLWMLFPSAPFAVNIRRDWYLTPHDELYEWIEKRHGHTAKWGKAWSYPSMSADLREKLKGQQIEPQKIGGASG